MNFVPFTDAIADVTAGCIKVKRRDYKTAGALPVVDQGQEFIGGYVDEVALAFRGKLPVIVFGDHTRVFKLVETPFALGADGVRLLQPKDGFDARFLTYFLRSRNLPNLGYSRHYKLLKEIRIPQIPPIEQHRIVDLLSRAEGIVRLRREAQRKTAELIPAIFLDLFGDPATNPKHWPVIPLGDLVERFEGGKNIQAGDEGASDYRILKISAVTSGRYIESESKPVPAEFAPPPSYFVRSGDLLFSRANTEALVGATALVEETNGKTLLPDKLWRFVWRDNTEVVPVFMLHLLQQPAMRAMLSKLASGTGGSMKNISQAKLKTLRVPLPPIELQRQFAAKAEAMRGIAARQSTALATAQATFGSLLHRAFADPQGISA